MGDTVVVLNHNSYHIITYTEKEESYEYNAANTHDTNISTVPNTNNCDFIEII